MQTLEEPQPPVEEPKKGKKSKSVKREESPKGKRESSPKSKGKGKREDSPKGKLKGKGKVEESPKPKGKGKIQESPKPKGKAKGLPSKFVIPVFVDHIRKVPIRCSMRFIIIQSLYTLTYLSSRGVSLMIFR